MSLWLCNASNIVIAFVLGAAIGGDRFIINYVLWPVLLVLGGCSGCLIWMIFQIPHNYSGAIFRELLTEQEKRTVSIHILISVCITVVAFAMPMLFL